VQVQSQFLRGVSDRIASTIIAIEDDKDTLQPRILENKLAIEKILNHPIMGIGLGNSYYATGEVWGRGKDSFKADGATRYIHNGWLYIPLKMGIPTLIMFIWLCYIFFRSSLANLSYTPIFRQIAFRVGFSAAFFGFLVQSLVANRFISSKHMTVIGLLLGLIAILTKSSEINFPMSHNDPRSNDTSD
jgi:O-antigen ligase